MIEKTDYGDKKRWFPKAGHLSDSTETIGDHVGHLCVDDDHSGAYIGDFPPKDTYREGIYD